jgi:hypothetical protein
MMHIPDYGDAPSRSEITLVKDRIEMIEKEISKMHSLINKFCPGSYGINGMTVAEKFEKFLAEGPEWVEIKKEGKE